ncbi:MAG: FAD-dependent oxidoreductase [Massilia sp.]
MERGTGALRVAIIGGGVSGLSTAYYLQKAAATSARQLQIDLYERKATLGGNADTVVVDLGNYIDGKGVPHAYLRWADLGVNDVNLATYVKLKAIMQEIGYLDKMKPLQDTTSYFNRSGSLALTDDAALREGVSDPAFSVANADQGKLAPLISVVHRSALNLLGTITPAYTVGHFFNACVAQPASMLGKAAAQLKISIDWDDPQLPVRLAQVRDAIYYPRIAAMYFTDERGPATLPLQSPFEYYRLQEGQGPLAESPDRRYFEHGAQKWLEALANHLLAHSNDHCKVTVHTEVDVRVQVHSGRVSIAGPAVPPAPYALCVLATHADDTMRLLSFDGDMGAWAQKIYGVLSQVSYTRGFAVCHTYAGQMPQNKNIWRTYNVLQRESSDASFPYRMSYVENLHQNDPVNPQYSRAGLPLFLISLVKSLDEIPRETMLDRVRQTHRIAPGMLAALPRATRRQLNGEALHTGYRHQNDVTHPALRDKAWTVFKHNVLNAECIAAQDSIGIFNKATAEQIAQGRQPSCALLFGGGWTLGAGLQEQCIMQSELIAGWIAPALRAAVSPALTLVPDGAATAA